MIRILNFTEYISENFGYGYLTLEGTSCSGTIVFIGGLEKFMYKGVPMKIAQQTEVLKSGLPPGFEVKSFSHFDSANIISYVQDNPGSTIICFSKGCELAPDLIKIGRVNPRKIFMIEPYHANGANKGLGKLGIPEKNFFVGSYAGVGEGIVSNPSKSNGKDHFDALATSARQICLSRTSENTTSKLISESSKSSLPKNIIIGDSQSLYVDMGSKKFDLISQKGSESALWKGGEDLAWLNLAVSKHRRSLDVENIAICIGTNGIFNKDDKISDLVTNIKYKFPNARLFAIKGSWAWPRNRYNMYVTEKQVNAYYAIFSDCGVEVIEPAIGPGEPHNFKQIYKEIGKNLDNKVQ